LPVLWRHKLGKLTYDATDNSEILACEIAESLNTDLDKVILM